MKTDKVLSVLTLTLFMRWAMFFKIQVHSITFGKPRNVKKKNRNILNLRGTVTNFGTIVQNNTKGIYINEAYK